MFNFFDFNIYNNLMVESKKINKKYGLPDEDLEPQDRPYDLSSVKKDDLLPREFYK